MFRRRLVTTASAIALGIAQAYAGPTGPTVDPTVPAANAPMSSSVLRNNFQATYNDLNNLITGYVGPTAPTSPKTYMLWIDNTTNPVVLKRWDGAQWVSSGSLDTVTHVFNPAVPADRPVSNAALRSLVPPADPNASIVRLGFYAKGDAPPLLFNWRPTGCGTPDNLGMCVQPSAGGTGAWQAAYDPSGIDPREFGAKADGVTDDTLAIEAIDTACTNAAGKIPPAVWNGIQTAGLTINLACRGLRLEGTGGGGIVPIASATNADYLVYYTGQGPVTVDGLTIACATYVDKGFYTTASTVPVLYALRILPDLAPATQVRGITVRNSRFSGCRNQLLFSQASDVDIHDNFFYLPQQEGIYFSQSAASLNVTMRNISVKDNTIIGPGAIGITMPEVQSTTLAPASEITITGNRVFGAGFIYSKGCYEVTTQNIESIFFDNECYDSLNGFVFKHNQPTSGSVGAVPIGYKAAEGKIHVDTHIDNGECGDIVNESPTDVAPEIYRAAQIEVWCNLLDPTPWQSGRGVNDTEVMISNGTVWQAVKPGTTGSTAPSGGVNTTFTDGTVTWRGRYAMPPTDNWTLRAIKLRYAATGSNYAVGDELSLPDLGHGACTSYPTLGVTSIGTGGSITGVEIVSFGKCADSVAKTDYPNPVGGMTTTGSGTGAQINLFWRYRAQNVTVAKIFASTDASVILHSAYAARGAQLLPSGDSASTISRLHVLFQGVTVGLSCLSDLVPFEFGTEDGYVNNLQVEGICNALDPGARGVWLGASQSLPAWAAVTDYYDGNKVTKTGATYVANCPHVYENSANGLASACTSGTVGPSAGSLCPTLDGTDSLCWTASATTSATVYYRDFLFTGTSFRTYGNGGAFASGTSGTCESRLNGRFVGTEWIGNSQAVFISCPASITWNGGEASIRRVPTSISASPIQFDSASGTGQIALLNGSVSANTRAQANTANARGWQATNGATGAVYGNTIRGWSASAPTATAGSLGDVYLTTAPSASVMHGWMATTASSSAATWTPY